MKQWEIAPEFAGTEAARVFADLDAVFALEGERVAKSPMTQVFRIRVGEEDYYLKRYAGLGKRPLRRQLDTPRVQAEWENLQRFSAWGIPTAPLVACGLEKQPDRLLLPGAFMRGALVTAGIPDATDLRQIATSGDARLCDRHWWDGISRQIARATRTMHTHGFAHNDLKWRNLLVDETGRVFFIDCPTGRFWWGPFLAYRIVKDLACLDKVAKHHLSRTRRLRFYLDYAQKKKLDAADKRRIAKVLKFFSGRE